MAFALVKSPKKYVSLRDLLPVAVLGLQANFCRNPSCANFGVPPNPNRQRGAKEIGAYGLSNDGTQRILRCELCGRYGALISNASLSTEINRLRDANGLLRPDSCPTKSCENQDAPVIRNKDRYYRHGKTRAGSPRFRCRACGQTFTIGDAERRQTAAAVNRDIVRDLINRASLNAILRKTGLSPTALYDRIDFIHRRMIAFEAFKVQKLKDTKRKHRRHFSLAVDGQDHRVNWESRDRRHGIQVSAITTADNLTGYVFRSDVTFDPTIEDVVDHFESLLDAGEFDIPDLLGQLHRYRVPSFLGAVAYALSTKGASDPRNLRLLEELRKLNVQPEGGEADGSPVSGVVVSPVYTALAHLSLVAEMLPSDADIHFMSDAAPEFVVAAPVCFREALKAGRADLTFVMFDKTLTTPKKQAVVGQYKKLLAEFREGCDPTMDDLAIRNAFMALYSRELNVNASGTGQWWTVPIETMYEPRKRVGIAYQRPEKTLGDTKSRKLELLARSSLHAVDSFFNVLRQRVSFLHRAGMSRSSQTFYNPFQAYRPGMIQKIVDISRVYFNWIEPRPFRLSRTFDPLVAATFYSAHAHLASAAKQDDRRTRREKMTTPAMRVGLAKAPVRLDTILYTNWRGKLLSPDLFWKAEEKKAVRNAAPRLEDVPF
jgi:transposase-like protein